MATAVQMKVEEMSVTESPAAMSPRTDWRRLFGLREMGVYYALLLLIAVLAIVTTYLGRTNYLTRIIRLEQADVA